MVVIASTVTVRSGTKSYSIYENLRAACCHISHTSGFVASPEVNGALHGFLLDAALSLWLATVLRAAGAIVVVAALIAQRVRVGHGAATAAQGGALVGLGRGSEVVGAGTRRSGRGHDFFTAGRSGGFLLLVVDDFSRVGLRRGAKIQR